jgi:O-antigen/teichoic acid export membrane protein
MLEFSLFTSDWLFIKSIQYRKCHIVQVLKQFSVLFFVRVILLIFGFLVGVLLVRWLGPEGKGILVVLLNSAALLSALLTLGLPTAALFLYKQERYSVGQLVATIMALWAALVSLTAIALVLFQKPFAALFLNELNSIAVPNIWLWLVLSLLPGLLVSSLLSVLLVLDKQNTFFIVWNLISQLLNVVLTVLLVGRFGLGVTGALVANGAMQSVALVVAGIWLVRLARQERLRLVGASLREMVAIGVQQYSVSLVAMIFKRAEIFLLALLLDLRAVGLYAVAVSFYDLVIDVPRALVVPVAGKIADRSTTDKTANMAMIIRLQAVAALVLVIGSALVLPPLVPILYGEDFRLTSTVLLVLLPGIFFRTVHLSIFAYYTGIGRPGSLLPVLIVATFVNIGLDLLLIPSLGVIGAALATVAGEAVLVAASLTVFLRSMGGYWAQILMFRPTDFQVITQILTSLRRRVRHL